MLTKQISNAILVADIGGTNIRFALAVQDHTAWQLHARQRYLCAEFTAFEQALTAYLRLLAEQAIPCPAYAGFAVAGPIQSGQVQLTNLPWQLNEQALMRAFNFEVVALVNDIAAVAYGLHPSGQANLIPLIDAPLQWQQPMVVVGIGTGFGAACLHASGQWIVASEAGHQQLAPYTAQQYDIWQSMRSTQAWLTVEQVLSGTGLARLHQHWRRVHQLPAQSLSPAQIMQQAIELGDEVCQSVVICFYQWLAAVLADMVLTQGALGGVVITGGVMPHLVDMIQARGDFAAHFHGRHVLGDYLQKVAVRVNAAEQTALIGAARSVGDQRDGKVAFGSRADSSD